MIEISEEKERELIDKARECIKEIKENKRDKILITRDEEGKIIFLYE